MELIFWRHADAQDGMPDMGRPLTVKGLKQAERMAAWLKPRLPKDCRILVSPALRAVQTADALGLDYEVEKKITPGADASALLAAAGWPDAGRPALLVGHQPSIGRACALLLFGQEADVSIKKGSVVWLSNRVRGSTPQTVLKAVMTPEML
ncbi:MAG: SixA phosphatase family protein [Thiobacillaceae bacterium]